MDEKAEAIGEADAEHEGELKEGADDVIGNRHAAEEKKRPSYLYKRRDRGGHDRPEELGVACEAPDAPVEVQAQERKQANDRVEGCEL